jgi:hypothetical protein
MKNCCHQQTEAKSKAKTNHKLFFNPFKRKISYCLKDGKDFMSEKYKNILRIYPWIVISFHQIKRNKKFINIIEVKNKK